MCMCEVNKNSTKKKNGIKIFEVYPLVPSGVGIVSTPKISLDVVKVKGVDSWFYNARNEFNTILCSKPNSLIRSYSYGKFLGILEVWKNYTPSSHIRGRHYYKFNK